MKKTSSPPIIIILDVLFAILAIMLLESSPNIQIVIPSTIMIEDAIIVSEDKSKKIKHWFNLKAKKWEDIKTLTTSNRKFNFIIGRISCENNLICKNIPTINNEIKKIYIIGDTYDQLSGMISDSCLKFPKECSNVIYHIKEDGSIDTKRLKRDYKFFRIILN